MRPLTGLVTSLAATVCALLAGCTGEPAAAPGGESPTTTSAVAPTEEQTTAAASAPSATEHPTRTTSPSPTDAPTGPGPHGATITTPPAGVTADGPVVVLVHGGAWRIGDPSQMDAWAEALAAEGAVVVNASYRLVDTAAGQTGDPAALDDIACAVRYARAEAQPLTTSDELVLAGHSAGGHLAAVIALDPQPYGADCPWPEAAPADRLVGLAGVYDVKAEPLLRIAFVGFVGAESDDAPDRWSALNPVELASLRPDLEVALVVPTADPTVPPAQAAAFAAALPQGAEIVELPGEGHNAPLAPTLVGVDVMLGT